MSKTKQTCAACYEIQQKLEIEANLGPATLKCFAGLCESAIPVRVGQDVIAFLHTGQVLLHKPTHFQFNRVAATLLKWGGEVDLKLLEDAYFHTCVLSATQYEAFIKLLVIFAEHLAVCSNQLLLRPQMAEPESIQLARSFIAEHQTEELSLRRVAQAVNLSATYFSELFKKTTGMNFIEFISRTRIEKAKNLLQNPNRRISQIAFDVGFQSLSQFNRAFKKATGKSPKQFQANVPA